MSSSDEILEQIDAAIHDWTVSADAMRWRPAPEPAPIPAVPVVPYTGRDAARDFRVRRLVGRGLTQDEAAAAVRAAENGEPTEHLELLGAEIRAATADAVQQLGRALAAFARTLQTAAAAARQFDAAFGKPGRRRDRPAWQSPYGPPVRRKR